MRKRLKWAWFTAVLISLMCGTHAFSAGIPELVSGAMKTLDVSKGDPDLLVLTNAPYVKINGQSALSFLDQAQGLTGCTVGKGNLLFFQRAQNRPMRLMLFKRSDGNAVIISRTADSWLKEALSLSEAAISSPSFWKTVKEDFKAGSDIFTLAAMANVWANQGPYDFLKSAELHNHICPGLTSGYLMSRYILNHYPLKQGERYTVIACPVWCKEDAFQVVLDCTPGKRGLIVKPLSKEQAAKVTVVNPAGFLLIWDKKQKSGKGVALSFSFDRLKALSSSDMPKAATVLAALEYLDKPGLFVSTAAEFKLDEKQYNEMMEAGNNPYKTAGLWKDGFD
ncbi:FmdE family protein [Desulfospira joergensenii]|uniref:FmdE family protein n=1 Tax=Desulfospira joergensenii TaxID=53329 RepID=UPI0003B45EA1|nr:FmdE family protein [Desulfospira joergensenii]